MKCSGYPSRSDEIAFQSRRKISRESGNQSSDVEEGQKVVRGTGEVRDLLSRELEGNSGGKRRQSPTDSRVFTVNGSTKRHCTEGVRLRGSRGDVCSSTHSSQKGKGAGVLEILRSEGVKERENVRSTERLNQLFRLLLRSLLRGGDRVLEELESSEIMEKVATMLNP